MKIALVNGPNLNMLGQREPEIYGNKTLKDVEGCFIKFCGKNNVEGLVFQSNNEGEIVDFIQKLSSSDILIINPGAYTHSSIAIYDAIKASEVKAVEVHISNIHAREEWRQKSVTAAACVGQISGFGLHSYALAMHYIEKAVLNKKTC